MMLRERSQANTGRCACAELQLRRGAKKEEWCKCALTRVPPQGGRGSPAADHPGGWRRSLRWVVDGTGPGMFQTVPPKSVG